MSACARSSVASNTVDVCNPVVTRPQEFPTNGKHSRTTRLSVMSGQRLKGFDQTENISRHIPARSSQIAPKFRCVAHMSSSTFPPVWPRFGAAFF